MEYFRWGIMNIISEQIQFDKSIINIYKISFYKLEDFLIEFNKHIDVIANGIIKRDRKKIYQRIQRFFDKQSETTVQGAIAELFSHVVLNSIGLRQASLFFNLEENSIKKGFDGLYLKSDDVWLMESKSSVNIKQTHIANNKLAIKDLKDKIEGNVTNNPWENALKHYIVSIKDRNEEIMKGFTKLSNDFEDKYEGNTNDFNVIPASTLFRNDYMPTIEELTSWLKTEKEYFKDIIVLCINNKLLCDFQEHVLKESM